ncbi:MAG: DnaJ domain-containing protein [Acidobacteria bacterium]|nr:DnaJ domain-containing protein [Acidobacteriota bacterium]
MCSGWREAYYGGTSLRKKKATTDYYQALGVSRDAEFRTIKSAYRRLVKRYHPDVARNKAAERRFLAIQEAYEVLSDPKRRRQYDRLISESVPVVPRSSRQATARSTAPWTVPSMLGRGVRMVVDALGIRIDAGVRFGGGSHRHAGRNRKQR